MGLGGSALFWGLVACAAAVLILFALAALGETRKCLQCNGRRKVYSASKGWEICPWCGGEGR